MAEYLVELYAARGDEPGARLAADRLRAACEQLTAQGEAVHYVRSLFVPEDETSFSLCRAASADRVRHAVALAGLGTAHVSTAVAVSGAAGPGREEGTSS
jgi:hypothetical protein